MSEQKTNMYMNQRVSQDFWAFRSAVKASGTVTDVLGWYQERKLQFPMLARFSTMIFSIPPSQAEYQREFFLTGVFKGSNRARMLVDMLSKLILINRNSIGIQHNHTADVFQGPVEDLDKVTKKC